MRPPSAVSTSVSTRLARNRISGGTYPSIVIVIAVFCYGTLEFAEVMAAVTGRCFSGSPATLHGYARYRVKDAAYPAIIAEAGARTPGTLYRSIDPQSLRRMDRYEDSLYVRRAVIVQTLDGFSVSANTYLVPPHRHWALSSKRWDAGQFARHDLKYYLTRLSQ